MYSKEQASALRQAFWTTFGQYIAPHPLADGLKINWINYKTGIKHINFRMVAEDNMAEVAIEISHPDTGLQELYFEQFKELKNVLQDVLQEEWNWVLHTYADGKVVSRIFTRIEKVSVFNRTDWPTLISFFKPRIIALDEFWSMAKYSFEALQ
ncbi:hypothetical protein GCM10027037_08920 [Mucilaginibacter koreensis]